MNVPIGIAVVGFSLLVLPGGRGFAPKTRLDIAGAVVVTASLMVAVYAIVNGNEVGWGTARTLGLLAISGALLGVFVLIESRVAAPLVPLRLFRLRNLSVSSVVGVLCACAAPTRLDVTRAIRRATRTWCFTVIRSQTVG